MEISHVILYAVVPIIVVMLAGFISGKRGVFSGEDAKKFNKVVLNYALPAVSDEVKLHIEGEFVIQK